MGSSINCFDQLAGDRAPAALKRNAAGQALFEQMQVSAFEPFNFMGGQKGISSFQLQDNELKNDVK